MFPTACTPRVYTPAKTRNSVSLSFARNSKPIPCKRNANLLTTCKQVPRSERAERKAELLHSIKGLNRGASASEEDRNVVDAFAKSCEAVNPHPASLECPLINGQWRLIYTTSESILGSSRPAPFRPAGPIFQYIDTSKMAALNRETWPFFNEVKASLTATSKSEVAVQFTFFKLLGLLPVKAPPTATGDLNTTYVDEELRIGRGNKGNLFVLLKEKDGCLL
ncbi:hypothetical protein CYMTET_4852 [Cymbomonas tetramitiformis]|uniref:Plastid lipid-associated protein/fibrillin conserved domain-containing protein n=1 Tax=Cymbomonas tetramitiformis TaxID=36881 RepID=A0AAE0H0K1_9CHLO|nr:hypothetical protein CYMTET_4852 [Cymbomonas tetramitiformis]